MQEVIWNKSFAYIMLYGLQKKTRSEVLSLIQNQPKDDL